MGDDGGVNDDAATPPAEPAEIREKPRMSRTVRDMVWSLAVVLVVVAAILLVTKRPAPDPIRVVDYAGALAMARAQADYPVLAPVRLGPDWRATSARWEPTAATGSVPAWHLGMIAPDGSYVQVAQAETAAGGGDDREYVAEQTAGGQAAGTATIAGRTWDRREAADPAQRSLVSTADGVTVVVTGTAAWDTLEAFAGSLQGG